jgi:hypothetical protein
MVRDVTLQNCRAIIYFKEQSVLKPVNSQLCSSAHYWNFTKETVGFTGMARLLCGQDGDEYAERICGIVATKI